MSVRLEDIEHVEWSLDDLCDRYLREHGWEYSCNAPDCCWHWSKKLADGRTLLTDRSLALAIEEASCPDEVRDL